MDSQLGILCGVIAMAGWGIGDFVVARLVRKTGALVALVWSQTIALIPYIQVSYSSILFR